ncbi:DUF2480 family protein [Cellulophaga baltica]|uniref:DUF2480 family protein n=1 Tax=Cellulophaga TaxID=104264 RepID=UPI001C073FF2|nr:MULTISPECIES: DUF2480 family protein [Cellulophaga]MBU2997663.1 DUF2480 family protein [Cellulophaga baltica]MDO6769058.1 DUF2480 family protein [Cellulophaga sp. 1_MG-2023]
MDEIVNRVSQSKLITFNLEDYYPKGKRIVIDIKDWLYEGFILREKDFREVLEQHDWTKYQDSYVALGCSTDAIIPGWAYMLIATKLQPYVKKVITGTLENLETILYQTIIENLDVSSFEGKPVIIKGCSSKPVPTNAYVMATTKIQTVAKNVMYGEACSSVPLFRKI